MKRALAIILTAILLLLALPLVVFGDARETYEATYEDEYDANGLRSRYGVWTHRNCNTKVPGKKMMCMDGIFRREQGKPHPVFSIITRDSAP